MLIFSKSKDLVCIKSLEVTYYLNFLCTLKNITIMFWTNFKWWWKLMIDQLKYIIIRMDLSLHKKMKLFIKDFFSKYDEIRFLRIWSHLLKKLLMENFIFCAVYIPGHRYRIFITAGSASCITNVLLNLIKHQQPDIENIYLYVKIH